LKIYFMAVMALFLQPYSLLAQATATIPATALTEASDSLIVSGEFDHIGPNTNGTAGSFQWLHADGHHFVYQAGVSSQLLGQTHWTLATAGLVWFQRRWTVESSLRAGHGSATVTGGFPYLDFLGAVTYRATPHLVTNVKAEYIDVATSHGSLFGAGVCICDTHRYSTTVSFAHSALGNLATEFVSIREERLGRTVSPFFDASVGKSLPRLLDPALDVYSSPTHTYSFSGGSRFSLTSRTILTAAASYGRTGAFQTITIALSSNFKIRGD
jgi:hypothetical protein